MGHLSAAAMLEFEKLQRRHPQPGTYRDCPQARRVLDELAGRVRYSGSGLLTAKLIAGPSCDPMAPFDDWRADRGLDDRGAGRWRL